MKTIVRTGNVILIAGIFLIMGACSKSDNPIPITIFSVNDDIAMGLQMDQEITGDPAHYPVLDSVSYASAYAHLYQIRNTILASGKLQYANTFEWKIRIIRDDSVVNAFCIPGGNIYIYTGIIKFLDNEAEFAGVLAHEMAHADLRHTSQQLTLIYGESLLLNLILGNNPSELAQIIANLAAGLGNLAYSRTHEYKADEYAVKYLYPTKYDAASLGDFFIKMEGAPTPPVFLSSHPSPEDRLDKINQTFNSLGGVHGGTFETDYQQFKGLLP
ncbi:MAG: M48 family metalloprotease [Bacteroidetes bacterium]|nr:M48 family metalloprotease [Bacteroidota bacterium]